MALCILFFQAEIARVRIVLEFSIIVNSQSTSNCQLSVLVYGRQQSRICPHRKHLAGTMDQAMTDGEV